MKSLWRSILFCLRWSINLFLLAIVIVFGINNHQTVTLNLYPSPFVLDVPAYLLVFVALIAGVILGAWSQWQVFRRQKKLRTKS